MWAAFRTFLGAPEQVITGTPGGPNAKFPEGYSGATDVVRRHMLHLLHPGDNVGCHKNGMVFSTRTCSAGNRTSRTPNSNGRRLRREDRGCDLTMGTATTSDRKITHQTGNGRILFSTRSGNLSQGARAAVICGAGHRVGTVGHALSDARPAKTRGTRRVGRRMEDVRPARTAEGGRNRPAGQRRWGTNMQCLRRATPAVMDAVIGYPAGLCGRKLLPTRPPMSGRSKSSVVIRCGARRVGPRRRGAGACSVTSRRGKRSVTGD